MDLGGAKRRRGSPDRMGRVHRARSPGAGTTPRPHSSLAVRAKRCWLRTLLPETTQSTAEGRSACMRQSQGSKLITSSNREPSERLRSRNLESEFLQQRHHNGLAPAEVVRQGIAELVPVHRKRRWAWCRRPYRRSRSSTTSPRRIRPWQGTQVDQLVDPNNRTQHLERVGDVLVGHGRECILPAPEEPTAFIVRCSAGRRESLPHVAACPNRA